MRKAFSKLIPVSLVILLAMSGAPGCKSTEVGSKTSAPAYAGAAQNYRFFASSEDLSEYLRYDSEAGPLISAHRGGPIAGYPENSLATMDRTLREAPALLEVDVRMTRDSVLVLLHDEDLDRTTTGTGALSAHAFFDARRLLLRDAFGIITPFRIPTLAEALTWAAGRAVLTLDVKPGIPIDRVVTEIRQQGAANRVVVIVYNLADLMAFRQRSPELNYSVPAETADELTAILDTGADPSRLMVWMGMGDLHADVIDLAHANGMRVILGTYGETDSRAVSVGEAVYEALIQAGVDVIATDRVSAAASAVERVLKFRD